MNLPNKLTVARLFMTGVFVILMSFDWLPLHIAAYLVFVLATMTDYYDGKIARERNLITDFGKLLDPVVDKVFLTAAFVVLMTLPDLRIPAWTIVVILAREFLVTGARSWAAAEGVVIAANAWGKGKAIVQMTYVFVFLFFSIVGRILNWIAPSSIAAKFSMILRVSSMAGIIIVALVTIHTGIQFARINWDSLARGKTI